MKRMNGVFALMIFLTLMENCPLRAAETAEQLISGAKKEGDEIVFVAGAQTFGGRKGLAELETGFNKKYRTEGAGQFCRRSRHECSGGAAYHRGKSRQKVFHGFISRFAIPLCAAPQGERSRDRELFGNISLGD